MPDVIERKWRVVMGDVEHVVYAADYEHAVARFEAWLIQRGIERRGAGFYPEDDDRA